MMFLRIHFRFQGSGTDSAPEAVGACLRSAAESLDGKMSLRKPLGSRDVVLYFRLGKSEVRGVLRIEAEQAPLIHLGMIVLSAAGSRIGRERHQAALASLAHSVCEHLASDPRFTERLGPVVDPGPSRAVRAFGVVGAVLASAALTLGLWYLRTKLPPLPQVAPPRIVAKASPGDTPVPVALFPYVVLDARELVQLDEALPRPTWIRLDFRDGRSFQSRWEGPRSYELGPSELSPRRGGTLFEGFRGGDSVLISIGYESPEPERAFRPLWIMRAEIAHPSGSAASAK